MKQGGNTQLNDWLRSHGVSKSANISAKYSSPAAQLYKDRLVAKVEGKPLPTELPKQSGQVTTVYDTSKHDSMSAGGFGATSKGVEPLSGESESDYVSRQRRLQAEARARMQAKFGKGGLGGVGSDSNYDPRTGRYGSGGGLDDTVSAISGGLRRLSTGAVEAVGQLGDRDTVSAATERVRDAWGGVVNRVASIRDNVSGDGEGGAGINAAAANSWAALRGLGASIGARVGEVAQKLATPDDDGLASILEQRRGELGSGKRMDGLGSKPNGFTIPTSSSEHDIDDLLASNRRERQSDMRLPQPPQPVTPPLRASSEPVAPLSAGRNSSFAKKAQRPKEPEKVCVCLVDRAPTLELRDARRISSRALASDSLSFAG